MTVLEAGAATDVGRVRQINEDRYLCEDGLLLFAVADGVGGHQAGEVAAQTAIDTLKKAFVEHTAEGLVDAVHEANEAVWRLAQTTSEKRGMGTTLTAVALVHEDGEDVLAVANVGDSRCYLLQRGELDQLTDDHSLVGEMVREGKLTLEEANVHPQRSIITRALGMDPEIEVDSWEVTPYRGDRLLLCSDGLTNELGDNRIAAVLRQVADPRQAARDLVRQARAEGGSDNITVVVIDVVDDDGRAEEASAALAEEPRSVAGTGRRAPGFEERSLAPSSAVMAPAREEPVDEPAPAPRRPTAADPPPRPADPTAAARPRRLTWRVVAFLVVLALVLVATTAAIGWYARSAHYVGLDGERVAIYKGRPGGVLWLEPTLEERTQLTRDQVLPIHHRELEAGKEVASKADADRYVNALRQESERARTAAPTTTTTTPAPTTTAAPAPGPGEGPPA